MALLKKICAVILLSATLITSMPPPSGHILSPRDIDSDNPENGNPSQPPTKLNPPKKDPGDPFSGSKEFAVLPESCSKDWFAEEPPQDCAEALNKSRDDNLVAFGGSLKLEDKSCSKEQVDALKTASWDATVLASFAAHEPKTAKEIATWKTYMGPDYPGQEKRITNNLDRVKDFYREQWDIVISCKDTKNLCNEAIEGNKVGGYAWTQKGWFGTKFYHITLCPVFFTLRTLEGVILDVEDDLKRGSDRFATEAEWQKNTGQYFMHEMMHLNSVGKPHINDELFPGGRAVKAYGSKMVHKMARLAISDGGGAEKSSTNADSYAWLANSIYFYDLTGYFPAPKDYKGKAEFAQADTEGLLHIDAGSVSSEADLDKALKAEAQVLADQYASIAQTEDHEAESDKKKAQCFAKGDVPFSKKEAEERIQQVCSNPDLYDRVVVPPISLGTGETPDGRNKVIGLGAPQSGQTVYGGVMFSNENCEGFFQLGNDKGLTDDDAFENCATKLRTIVEDCPDTGGILKDVCAFWVLEPAKESPFSVESWYKNKGQLKCEKFDHKEPIKGLEDGCTCWYEGYPGLKDLFKAGGGGSCKPDDVNLADFLID